MVLFHSLPVPELGEWVFSIPFLFPNFGLGIIHSRSRSQTPKCHPRSPLWHLIILLQNWHWNPSVGTAEYSLLGLFPNWSSNMNWTNWQQCDYAMIIIIKMQSASWEIVSRHDLFLDIQTWIGQTGSSVIGWTFSWHKLLPTDQKCRDTNSLT